MKKKIPILIILSSLFFHFGFSLQGDKSCSTFMLHHGLELIAGHNLDGNAFIPGVIVINKRNVYKEGVTWEELSSSKIVTYSKPNWTSKYGSVTFNPMGRDFPDGGMNEEGLFIWEMSLNETRFIEDEAKPKLFMMQWMQYQLDNHESIDEVIKSASEIMLDGWAWHFFTADRNGTCSSIEFLDGKLVIHAGENMPVTALCNAQYSLEMKGLKEFKGFGGGKSVEMEKRDIPRFVHAAHMIKNYDPAISGNIVFYGFDILKQLERGGTQWSVICDLKNLHVYLRTPVAREIRHFSLKSFDLSCNTPVKMIDMHANLSGDITKDFVDYTPETNRKFVQMSSDAVSNMAEGFEESLISQGITLEILIDRLAKYPESTVCKE